MTEGAGGSQHEGFADVDRIVETAIADGAFPGAVVAVGHRGRLVHLASHGRLTYAPDAPPIQTDTLWDVASLTKVVATTTVAMILVDEGKLALEAPVQEYLPRFAGPDQERVTVRHLLAHCSGIDWWAPLYREVTGQAAYVDRIAAMPLIAAPGTQELYSDLGIILLGAILEQVSGAPLDRFVAERVLAPLGMRDTRFRPDAALLPRIPPTEREEWRGRVVHGEVHDENAFAMGGIAPHAGLFSTASDLARFAQAMLDVLDPSDRTEPGDRGDRDDRTDRGNHDPRIVERATLELFTRRAGIVPGSDRALGWDTKSAEGSTAGTLFSPSSFGHTGFTGTSLWIDPERELYLILLTNRVHPTRENRKIVAVRPAVADAVVRAIER